jgi:large conductance mechanosensitive channel
MIGVPASTARPRGKNEGLQGLRYAGEPRRACRRFHHGGRIRRSCHHFTNWLLSLIPAGATNFGDTKFGLFLTALVSFLVIAAVVYFFIVTPYEKVKVRFGKQEAEASDPDDIVLLKEIRDLLASRQGGAV